MATDYGNKSIVTDGLMFCFDAANRQSYAGSGTSWDSIINNQTGTLINGPTFNTYNGGAITLDGTNDYIQVDNFDNTASTIYSFDMFARWRTGTSDMFMGFSSYDIWTWNGNLGWNTGVGDVYGISSTQVNNLNLIGTANENWHHYVFIFSTQVQNNKMYIDGQEQTLSFQRSSTNLTSTRTFQTSFRLGSWNNNLNYLFNGEFASVRVYNRAITVTEAQQNYNALKGKFE
jgi:hypothetical protein